MNESELFEAYAKGTLPVDERHALEQRLRNEPALAEEYRVFMASYDLVGIAADRRLKRTLEGIHEEMHAGGGAATAGRVVRMFPRAWLAIAASLVIVFGAAMYLLAGKQSTAELYAEHISAYPAPDRLRDDASAADPWVRFGDLYAAADYDAALPLLDSVTIEQAPAYLTAFYRGQCSLLKKEPDPRSAVLWLNMVLITDNDLHDAANWYLVLCDLKTGDAEQARYRLSGLRERGRYKPDEVKELLRALK